MISQNYGVQARIELLHTHAPLLVGAMLFSLGEGFRHVRFDQIGDDGPLCDVYANECFCVTYYLMLRGRDEIAVHWLDPDIAQVRHHSELLVLARQLAHMLGGGANPRLQDYVYPWDQEISPENAGVETSDTDSTALALGE